MINVRDESMEIIYASNLNYNFKKPTAIGLGNFDGLHIGHMTLINTLINESVLNSLESVVYTFMKHPENIIRKKLFVPLIATMDKKIEILSKTRLNYTYFEKFNESYSRIKPESFIKEILIDKLKMKLVVAGYDYRFGYKGEGNVKFLKTLGKKYDFKVVIIPPVKLDNEIVSSTNIRKYIKKGYVDKVFLLLGRYYSIKGEVERGRGVGKTLGFPTANITARNHLILPKKGVYITKIKIENNIYSSITNVGSRPTFDDGEDISIESFIMDFNNDIYGKNIEVFFIKKIRNERKFSNIEELILEMKKDLLKARNYFILKNIPFNL